MSVTHRPVWASGGLALAVTVATALALGASTFLLGEAVAGLAAAALLTAGTLATERENNAVRAAGSAAVVLGGVVAVGAVLSALGGSFAYAALGISLPLTAVAMALGVVVAPDPDTLAVGKSALRWALALLAAGCLGAAAIHTNSLAMPLVLAADLLGATVDVATSTDLAGLATLCLCLGALAALGPRADAALPERYRPRDRSDRGDGSVAKVGLLVGRAVGVLGAGLLLLSFVVGNRETPLEDAVGRPLGGLLSALATARSLHAVLAGLAVLLAAVLVGARLYRRIDRTTPDDVGDRLARAAGGVALLVATPLAATAVSPVSLLGSRLPDPAVAEVASLVSEYGTGTVLYLLVAAAVLLAVVATAAFGAVLTADAVPEGAGGVALGAGLLFVGALGAAAAGAGPLLVLGAGAAALFVWDVGENGTALGRQLGRAAETRRGEFVHGGASALVAGGAVVVAYGSGTAASSVTVPSVGWLLVASLTLSAVAGVLFLLSLRT